MNAMVKKMAALMSACFLLMSSAITVEEARVQAMSSTNFWGISFAEYRLRIGESVPFLATNGSQSAHMALCDWYVSLAGLSSPTNSATDYDSWLDEQVVALSAYSRFLLDPPFTNAWNAAASRLGVLRDGIPTEDDLRMGIKSRFFVNGLFADDNTVRTDFLRDQDFVFARQRASDVLARSVVEVFGRRGIPMLPMEERSAFASNYVSSARLSAVEANVILQGLNR